MSRYCVISLRQGRGVRLLKKIAPGSMIVLLVLSFFAYGTKVHAVESGSYDLNLDSAQDMLDISKTVNGVVGEVINDLTPTDLFNIGTNLPLNLPLNPLNHIKGFGISVLDTDTTDFDFTRFFSPAGISTDDIWGILKGIGILSIQIFIVVISVVTQIVKGILGALN